MPCRMDDMPDTSKDDLIEKLRKEGDKATAHLCAVMELFDKNQDVMLTDLPASVQKWWTQHKKRDEKRVKREKIEAEIAKLQKDLKEIE